MIENRNYTQKWTRIEIKETRQGNKHEARDGKKTDEKKVEKILFQRYKTHS